jgi:hypothetical protein
MNGNVQLKTQIDSSLHTALARLARAGDRTLAGEVRRAVREYVERQREGRGERVDLRDVLRRVAASREFLTSEPARSAAILVDLEADLADASSRLETSDV